MKKIILDTNFLLIPLTLKVDIFSEIERICNFPYELCVVDKTMDELETIIADEKTKFKKAAQFAKMLITEKKINIIETNKEDYVDDVLVDIIEEGEYIIATQDADLKKRLKHKGAQVVVLRQKKYLEMI